jgi:hypothetical protein
MCHMHGFLRGFQPGPGKSAFRCLMDFGTGKSAVSRSCLIIRSLEATWTDETIPLWTGLGLSLAFVLLLTCKLT